MNFICGCCKDKPKAPSFKRMEKLMDHKNKFHGYLKGARLLHCLEASCQAESTCVLCFCAEDGLEHHMSQAHQYKARGLPDRLHVTGLLDETKGTSVRRLICKILICRYSYLLVVGNIQQGSSKVIFAHRLPTQPTPSLPPTRPDLCLRWLALVAVC
jgi:hypothetical protein